MITRSTAVEFEIIGGDVPSDELLVLLADILLDLAETDRDLEHNRQITAE